MLKQGTRTTLCFQTRGSMRLSLKLTKDYSLVEIFVHIDLAERQACELANCKAQVILRGNMTRMCN